jgi:hypothetical protein
MLHRKWDNFQLFNLPRRLCWCSHTKKCAVYIQLLYAAAHTMLVAISSFVQTFLTAMFAVLLSTHALNNTGFLGLVQVAAESECGASLHGHRKCSQAGRPLVNRDIGELALEGGYT